VVVVQAEMNTNASRLAIMAHVRSAFTSLPRPLELLTGSTV